MFTQHYGTDGARRVGAAHAARAASCRPTTREFAPRCCAIADELTVDGLVLRYRVEETDDGLTGEEGTFIICSFWLVSALVRDRRPRAGARAVREAAVVGQPARALRDALVALGLALREEAEVGDFRGGEELRGAVRTLRDAGAALDAFGGIHRAFLHRLRNQQRVRFDRAAGVDGDVAAGLDDLVERTAVDDEVLDDREGARAPRLDADVRRRP